jgi:hypothetical protein
LRYWGFQRKISDLPVEEKPLRHISFSGYDWSVRSSLDREAPGPNRYSDSSENVSVDAKGRLHMKILRDQQRVWTCAEIVSTKTFGYGIYRFRIGSVKGIDRNAVLGLFTWSDDPAYNNREIDIEISRWSERNNPNAQFVVQPHTIPQNVIRFEVPITAPESLHEFSWKEDEVRFESQVPGKVIQAASIQTGIPIAGDENVRIDFWLNRGAPPAKRRPVEAVIHSFEYLPLGAER